MNWVEDNAEKLAYAIKIVDDYPVCVVQIQTYDDTWYVKSLLTDANHRHKGHAKSLMTKVLMNARAKNIQSVSLVANVGKKPWLATFYESLGFKKSYDYDDGKFMYTIFLETSEESLFDYNMVSITNVGHGHVWPRPDGIKARCGGPGICIQCSKDQADFVIG